MIEHLSPDFNFEDERGTICQLVHDGWKQVNVIVTKAGSRRGRMHYHVCNREAFYVVSGKIEYQTKSVTTGEGGCQIFSAGDFWCVQPHVGHDFYFLEDTVHVAMYDLGVDLPDGTRDIIEVE